MIEVFVEGVGVFAPGLVGWREAAAVLAGGAPYQPVPAPRLSPSILAPDVRRRTTDHIRLAIEVATEAVLNAGRDPASLPSVFASSESDGQITHYICEEVVKNHPEVSPTRFHNSVNNAPAGYWSMAAGSRAPSTSLAGFDGTFAVGLVEACAQLVAEGDGALLLVAHDTPLPEPLNSVRPMIASFGMALVLSRSRSARSQIKLVVCLTEAAVPETRIIDPGLEALRSGNPAARALPVLSALARATEPACIVLPYVRGRSLQVATEPCRS